MEKQSNNTIKKFNSRMQARLLLVFCVVTCLLLGLMGRLIYINQADGERYAKQVLSRQSYVSSVLPYKRGDILDRNGTVLARSELQYKVILDPKLLLENKEHITPTISALTENFEIEAETLQSILEEKPDSQYVIVLKNQTYEKVKAFKELNEKDKNIIGVWFEEEYVRSYPNKTLACDVLGFTSADNIGYFGIEEYYNKQLNGTNGREYGYYDSSLNIERIVKKAVNGNSIVSTIDLNAQRIIQEHIKEFNAEFGSKSIGILVMDPNSGEVIAMASNQEYDLNDPRNLESFYTAQKLTSMTEDDKIKALNTIWKNDVISSGFEPGSTFKPVTIAAALEEAVVTQEDTYYCDGKEEFGGIRIKCSKVTGHGQITLSQALMLSCNDALMQIANKEGRNMFYQYHRRFGFGQKTGIDLPGEEAGLIIALDKLNATELATSSFGQSFNTTMIQMAAAYSSLVNGGYFYQPHVVKQIVNDNGATVKEYGNLLVKQTVSENTSDFIQQSMYLTVEEGTAGGAKVEGYAIGGKTGTAQKTPRSAKTYVVSFLGHVPAIDPEVVIYVMIDEPQNVVKQADSSIATKFASRIMKELLPALGIFPDGEIDYLLNPDNDEDTSTEKTQEAQTQNEADQSSQNEQAQENAEENAEDTDIENNTSDTKEDDQDTVSGTNEEETSVENEEITETNKEIEEEQSDSLENIPEEEFNPDALD